MGVPTGIFANSFPDVDLLNLLSTNLSISLSFDFWFKSMVGKFVLYFLPFIKSPGLLFMPGISVALNISITNQAFSAFLVMICFYSVDHMFNTPYRLVVVCAVFFSTVIPSFMWKFVNSSALKQGPLSLRILFGNPKLQ